MSHFKTHIYPSCQTVVVCAKIKKQICIKTCVCVLTWLNSSNVFLFCLGPAAFRQRSQCSVPFTLPTQHAEQSGARSAALEEAGPGAEEVCVWPPRCPQLKGSLSPGCRLEGKKTEKSLTVTKSWVYPVFSVLFVFFFNKFSMTKWRRYWERPYRLQAAKEMREFVCFYTDVQMNLNEKVNSFQLIQTGNSPVIKAKLVFRLIVHRGWFGSKTLFSLQNTNTIQTTEHVWNIWVVQPFVSACPLIALFICFCPARKFTVWCHRHLILISGSWFIELNCRKWSFVIVNCCYWFWPFWSRPL